jgi:histone H3
MRPDGSKGTGKTIRKKRRSKQGVKALREMKRYQKSTDQVIPNLPFYRLVREITQQYMDDLRWQATGLEAIKEAAEQYLTEVLKGSNDLAVGLGSKTLQDKHIQLYQAARNNNCYSVAK